MRDVPLSAAFLPIRQPFLHKTTIIKNTENSPPPTIPTIKPTSIFFTNFGGLKSAQANVKKEALSEVIVYKLTSECIFTHMNTRIIFKNQQES